MEYSQSVSGFKVKGCWDDVVSHGQIIEELLRDITDETYEAEIEEFSGWRPKNEDQLDQEISEKTAEQASIDKNGIEKEKSIDEEISNVKEDAVKTKEDVNDPSSLKDDLRSIVKRVYNILSIETRRSVRNSEEIIYKNVMSEISPYYFDNELISANISGGDEVFVFEVNINDDDIKDRVQDELADYY